MTSRSFDFARALAVQNRLAERVIRRDRIGPVRRIAGVDVSISGDRGRAAVAVLEAGTLEILEVRTADGRIPIPYVPGFLAFRELPLIRRAFEKLSRNPDLAIVDGMGILHPRRLGIASHLGLVLDIPAIGCGKSPFIGEYEEPGSGRGSWKPVICEGERLGAAVRTRDGANVVFASTGHRVSLPTAIRWILRTAVRFRLPEPIRAAHGAAAL